MMKESMESQSVHPISHESPSREARHLGQPFIGLHEPMGLWAAALVGLQHVFAMAVGIITPPLVIGQAIHLGPEAAAYLVSMALFASGLTTLLQVTRVGPLGSGLLSVQGTSFAFVAVATQAGDLGGLPLVLGMAMATAPTTMVVSRFLGGARRVFPPVVTGTVVVLIGLSLVRVGLSDFVGGVDAPNAGAASNVLLGGFVMVAIVLVSQYGRGFLRSISIFLGIVAGYALAALLGLVDFSAVHTAPAFALPIPLKYGVHFEPGLVFPWMVAYLISAMEAVGDLTATSGASREPTSGPVFEARLRGGVLADGLGGLVAGAFNSLPVSTYAQNNGIIKLTGIASRRAGVAVALFLMAFGLFPKLGALIWVMPKPVLGGASTVLFGMVAVGGLRIISKDALTMRNELVAAVSLALGLGVTFMPEAFAKVAGHGPLALVMENGVAVGTIVALALNLLLPRDLSQSDEAGHL